jgi:hypothetical protein
MIKLRQNFPVMACVMDVVVKQDISKPAIVSIVAVMVNVISHVAKLLKQRETKLQRNIAPELV